MSYRMGAHRLAQAWKREGGEALAPRWGGHVVPI